ncbi:MAG: 3-dehydroquinate synthase [Flavobacteriaceae bacterium]
MGDHAPGGRATVSVDLGERSYDILIGPGLIDEAGALVAALAPGARAAIVSDSNVARHHLKPLQAALDLAGVRHGHIVVPPGESSKCFRELERVTTGLLDMRIERGDLVVALGGGVVGDLAGFAAAILRRGVRLVQVPTSLLAQVDSSVGGKTGIDTAHGKNLVGAFHQPSLVIADTASLDTLPEREFRAGYAEVAKYGLLGDKPFFEWLEANRDAVFAGGAERRHAIAESCRAKAAIVSRDETETGDRALLNLGHTFGHAFEAAKGYSDALLHGEAISIGMVCAFEFSERLGLTNGQETARMRAHLEATGLPVSPAEIPGGLPGIDALMALIAQDKKVSRGELTFILVRGIGEAFVARGIDATAVHAYLSEKISSGPAQ